MGKVISVLNAKGGSGKTTTSQALISGLSERGFKVLGIDLDPQRNLTFALKGDFSKPTIEDLFNGTEVKKVIQKLGNISLISSTPLLTQADREFTETGREYILREALEPIKNDFDYIIIDCLPHVGILVTNALTVADEVIIPTNTEAFSLIGISDLGKTINTIKKYTNPNLVVRGFLITMCNPRRIITRELSSELEKYATALNTTVFKTRVRVSTAIVEAQLQQQDLLSYDSKSKAIQDYRDFIKEYLGE